MLKIYIYISKLLVVWIDLAVVSKMNSVLKRIVKFLR